MIGALHATPAEQMTRSDDASYGRPSGRPSSRARTIGRPKASPTMPTTRACVSSTVASSSWASKDRPVRVVTVPPAVSVGNEAKMNPVLCMSGDAGMADNVIPCSQRADGVVDRRHVRRASEEEVTEPQRVPGALPDPEQHPFRKPGGAARVGQEDVLVVALQPRRCPGGRQHLLVGDGAGDGRERMTRPDLDQHQTGTRSATEATRSRNAASKNSTFAPEFPRSASSSSLRYR